MARFLSLDETTARSQTFAGTFGYMAPEYVRDGIYSTKCDLYRIGVLMLELVSGLRVASPSFPDNSIPSIGERRIVHVEGSFDDGGRPLI
ncbi:hypothetical protein LXL04_029014 [Taraxacum kok-saghyz]